MTDLERAALSGTLHDTFLDSEAWGGFQTRARSLWGDHDHVIVRGVRCSDEGTSLLLLALLIGRRFKPYKGDKVVKHFRMSPWTRDLSHTLQEGHFHTDINTAPQPPLTTAIQCRIPDPGAPGHGVSRVARLADLLQTLRRAGEASTLAFLQATDVTMVNDSSPDGWTGRIATDERIRFHPETLRAAHRRYGNLPADMETHLQIIKQAALDVSFPIHLDAGDTLLVSNTRALHYRGECSVVYRSFPRDFIAREIYVLHLLDEPR
ncbi:TauD/TfdA family dioxygenase [Chondromyces apiculatus]|uniref:TauD/TfdA family dioxygenase n=1 Tax=Chondromyces apiculatus TaxID=51 RepID=UPI0018CC4DF0|nr:TauD/TfdA family dioxygenase [Chondromyces apiculatus]